MLSRLRRAVLASSGSRVSIMAHRLWTGCADSSNTSVIRPSLDLRRNSAHTSGPSSNQWRRIGKVRVSQISDPHPRQAITLFVSISSFVIYLSHSPRSHPHQLRYPPQFVNFVWMLSRLLHLRRASKHRAGVSRSPRPLLVSRPFGFHLWCVGTRFILPCMLSFSGPGESRTAS